jgi:selenocysteine-specific elongation factor
MNGIVGTAGHIDHGKTALIGALTGESTDRLPEEQARGISIDLGFSHLEVGELRLGVVDVPGHEDFIRNMLAGATGIDVLLLVVAADEGVMPQTREHTAIAELLGVERAVVALTKSDLVSDEWLGLVHDDVAGFLDGTPFAGAAAVPTSTVSGRGMEELRAALAAAFRAPRGTTDDLFRMPVDRAFTVRGTGTVVTGTVWSGTLAADAAIRLLPDGPECRVRGLQVHGTDVAELQAGERGAIALVGADRDDVERGMTAVTDQGWEASRRLTAHLRVLPGSDWAVEQHQRVRVHLGTAEVMARVFVLDREILLPGEEGWVQLRLEAPLLGRARDRFVIRSYSPVTTIGGGVVAEPVAAKRTRLDPPALAGLQALVAPDPGAPGAAGIAWLLGEAGGEGVREATLPVRTGLAPAAVHAALDAAAAVPIGDRWYAAEALAGARDALIAALETFHDERPLRSGMEVEALRRAAPAAAPELVERAVADLLEEDRVTRAGSRIARRGWTPRLTPAQEEAAESIVRRLAEAGPEAPRVAELAPDAASARDVPDLLGLLEEWGRVARVEHDLFLDAGAADRIVRQVRDRLGGREGLSPGDFRDVVDVSRKHLMPILAWLDREGVTVRSAAGRAVPV